MKLNIVSSDQIMWPRHDNTSLAKFSRIILVLYNSSHLLKIIIYLAFVKLLYCFKLIIHKDFLFFFIYNVNIQPYSYDKSLAFSPFFINTQLKSSFFFSISTLILPHYRLVFGLTIFLNQFLLSKTIYY